MSPTSAHEAPRDATWAGAPADTPAGGSARPFRSTGATVIVVDDERDIRFLLRFVLEKNGYRVVEAVHGASAMELLRVEAPALIITDLMMPVMDGAELIVALRADVALAHIPVILTSACPERAPRDQFDLVMPKPFRPNEMLEAVHALLDEDAS